MICIALVVALAVVAVLSDSEVRGSIASDATSSDVMFDMLLDLCMGVDA